MSQTDTNALKLVNTLSFFYFFVLNKLFKAVTATQTTASVTLAAVVVATKVIVQAARRRVMETLMLVTVLQEAAVEETCPTMFLLTNTAMTTVTLVMEKVKQEPGYILSSI